MYRNPIPTVDLIIEISNEIALIERRNPPYGWALPGGYIDYGESVEAAAIREAREETFLEIDLIGQFHTYSDPKRDLRQHNISVVLIARASGVPQAGSDAKKAQVFSQGNFPQSLVFDHDQILDDFFELRKRQPLWQPAVKTCRFE